jgi:hypothetical protein
MKKNVFVTIGLTSVFAVAIFFATSLSTSSHYAVYANSMGSPGGKTNSPGDGASCVQCHTQTFVPSATVTISAPALAGGYVPGQTYTINAAISGTSSSKIGFEVTAERDLNDAKIGTIIITDPTRTITVNSGNAITHNSAAGTTATSGTNAWTFDWTAPTAGTGDITFYGAFNATNNNSTMSGDFVYMTSLAVQESIPTSIADAVVGEDNYIYPNPATTFFSVSSKFRQVELFNMNGEKVLEKNQMQNKINIEQLSKGVYFVRLQDDKNIVLEKLIIQ